MKKTVMVSVLSLALMGSSMSAMADDRGFGGNRGGNDHAQPQQMHQQQNNAPHSNADRDMRNGPMNDGSRGYESRDNGPRGDQSRNGGEYSHNSHNDEWQRGGKVPNNYFHETYYVDNWHNRAGLYEPPRGYRWLDIDGNYVLAAVATGIISAILWGR